MWVTASFLNVMMVTSLGKNLGTQFPWQLLRYVLALNTCDKSAIMNLFLHKTLKPMSCGLPYRSFSPEPFNYSLFNSILTWHMLFNVTYGSKVIT